MVRNLSFSKQARASAARYFAEIHSAVLAGAGIDEIRAMFDALESDSRIQQSEALDYLALDLGASTMGYMKHLLPADCDDLEVRHFEAVTRAVMGQVAHVDMEEYSRIVSYLRGIGPVPPSSMHVVAVYFALQVLLAPLEPAGLDEARREVSDAFDVFYPGGLDR